MAPSRKCAPPRGPATASDSLASGPRSLHKRLKLAAVERETPMTDLARQALSEWLDSLG